MIDPLSCFDRTPTCDGWRNNSVIVNVHLTSQQVILYWWRWWWLQQQMQLQSATLRVTSSVLHPVIHAEMAECRNFHLIIRSQAHTHTHTQTHTHTHTHTATEFLPASLSTTEIKKDNCCGFSRGGGKCNASFIIPLLRVNVDTEIVMDFVANGWEWIMHAKYRYSLLAVSLMGTWAMPAATHLMETDPL